MPTRAGRGAADGGRHGPVRLDRASCRVHARQAGARLRRPRLTYAALARAIARTARRARRARRQSRRSRGASRLQQHREARPAVRLRAARRAVHAAHLAAGRRPSTARCWPTAARACWSSTDRSSSPAQASSPSGRRSRVARGDRRGVRRLDAVRRASSSAARHAVAAHEPDAGYATPGAALLHLGLDRQPKGVVLTQNALFRNAVNSTHMHDLSAPTSCSPRCRCSTSAGSISRPLPALHAGATVVLHPQFDAEAGDRRDRARAHHADGAGAGAARDDDGASALAERRSVQPAHDHHRLHHRRRSVRSRRACSAACRWCRSTARPKPARSPPICGATTPREHPGSAGKPALHCERAHRRRVRTATCAAGATGEILVRGPNVMDGYWNKPRRTRAAALAAAGSTRGDIGHCDADGYLYVDGRRKDMIISGGENIYPAEIENVLPNAPTSPRSRWSAGPTRAGARPSSPWSCRARPQISRESVCCTARRPHRPLQASAAKSCFVDELPQAPRWARSRKRRGDASWSRARTAA